MSKSDIIRDYVLLQVGSPYVYGATGKLCTPAMRRQQIAQYPDFAASITKHCPVLSGKQVSCAGCKYHGKLAFDCAQLTRKAAEAAGLKLPSGSTTQYRKGDWSEGGDIKDLPPGQVAFLYRRTASNVPHTGVTPGDGTAVDARGHASGVVHQPISQYPWTDYKILRGQEDKEPENMIRDLRVTPGQPLMRGDDVIALQSRLVALGYSVGAKGPDGIFGWDTERAVRAWQKDIGMAPDGVFEAGDWARLEDPPVDSPGSEIPPKPEVDRAALLKELAGLNAREARIIQLLMEAG